VNGKPKKGTIQDRHDAGEFGYVEPNKKKKQMPYSKYMADNKLTREMVLEEAARQGLEVNPRHFEEALEPAPAKGRRENKNKPKKTEVVGDSEEEGEAAVAAPAPKRGGAKEVANFLEENRPKPNTRSSTRVATPPPSDDEVNLDEDSADEGEESDSDCEEGVDKIKYETGAFKKQKEGGVVFLQHKSTHKSYTLPDKDGWCFAI